MVGDGSVPGQKFADAAGWIADSGVIARGIPI
jgi:hypothetical protein